MHDKYAPAM